MEPGLRVGADGRVRCAWAGADPLYVRYHDEEWGRPVLSDTRLYEKLCLEGFQAGLSWLTILRKREAFRRAFCDFEPRRVARFGPVEIERLLADRAIVRHRGKIEAAIHNARCVLELQQAHGSFARWVWRFAPPSGDSAPIRVPAATRHSKRLARALKARGFRFVGPRTAYAFMQAMGLVNDHLAGCWCREEVERLCVRVRSSLG